MKSRAGQGAQECRVGRGSLKSVDKMKTPEKGASGQRLAGGEGGSLEDTWKESIPGTWSSRCKGHATVA